MTGCDTGFGNILAKRLDALGCHVFAGCLTPVGGEELKKECLDRLKVVWLDVSNAEIVKKAFELVKAALPEGKVQYRGWFNSLEPDDMTFFAADLLVSGNMQHRYASEFVDCGNIFETIQSSLQVNIRSVLSFYQSNLFSINNSKRN